MYKATMEELSANHTFLTNNRELYETHSPHVAKAYNKRLILAETEMRHRNINK